MRSHFLFVRLLLSQEVAARTELEFALPFASSATFPGVLRFLESQMGCRVGMSAGTLEEVFLVVAEKFAGLGTSLEDLKRSLPYVETSRSRRRQGFRAMMGEFQSLLALRGSARGERKPSPRGPAGLGVHA